MDIVDTLRRGEGKTLEFKRNLSSPDGVLRTLVAFANTAGGVLLVGVDDRTGHVRGLSDPLLEEERVANLISDSIRPRLLPDIEILNYRNRHVLAIRTYPSQVRPHYLAKRGLDGGAYVRVGSTNRLADAPLVAEMQRFRVGEAFDQRPMPELDSEAVDFGAASELFAPARELRREDLQTLRLLVPYQDRLVPTVGGVLICGRDRLAHFPDAWIHAGRFGGADKARIIDQARISGPLASAVERAIGFVEKHSLHGAVIGRARRREAWSLPPEAVREAIVNAVVHADYSQRGAPLRVSIFDDRLEVDSPGLLPFGLTLEDLPLGVSKLRNPVIGRVFHELGLVEQWGSGVQRMIAACRDSGLPMPVWEEVGIGVRVTLRAERVGEVQVDATNKSILDLLGSGDGLSTSEVAAKIGLSPRGTRTRLAKLVARGLAREIGTGPRDPRRRYVRVAD